MQNGILPLWKEQGMTSHDCVFKLRKILRMKRIGHTGTLDPSVEGVLPICLGESTKVAEYLTNAGKTYEAEVTIGTSTTTEDADGEVVETDASIKHFTRQGILDALLSLTGTIDQTPPMYSAVKVNGKKLYEYARAGQTIERPTRQVNIYELTLLSKEDIFSGELISFNIRVSCSKGTYIRTLAVQIGEKLGFPAHMSKLVRTASGSFTAKDCLTLSEVQQLVESDSLRDKLYGLDYALQDMPKFEVPPFLVKSIQNGQVLDAIDALNDHERVVFTMEEQAVAVYINHPTKEGKMKPEKMFNRSEGGDTE
ncbi:tRNA pseudouridine(55) synthase TruB [Paenisporosarcina quisquiliarum]|uniref:tRNA pseudouridine synthase B n=1 Tax=Paenisporosarcina quisquiliarum TaxID=365346 RepID=A0A9X3LE68_9BACL|nr:tRNA pseudouridine(55) synthase TruB [Paenisporosarcina quisquiliarum]MCZ8535654.1 tRNA pseudouridine(55) synthase TruB [Paenisporosarcina quisquiliarum]